MIERGEPGERPYSVAFALVPCRCVADHNPEPEAVELHHIFPAGEQRRIWGRVRDNRLEPMCGTSHTSTHAYLDWLLGKRPERPTVGPYIRQVARLGYERIRMAEMEAAYE